MGARRAWLEVATTALFLAAAAERAGAESGEQLACVIFPPLCDDLSTEAEPPPTPFYPPPSNKVKELAQAAVTAADNAVVDTTNAIGSFGSANQLETANAATVSASAAFAASQKAVEGGLVDVSTYVAHSASLCLQALAALVSSNDQSKAADFVSEAEDYANEAARMTDSPELAPIAHSDAYATASVTVHASCGSCTATAVAHSFAISIGGKATASAFATASCTVQCVQASQDAFDSGSFYAAGAGAAHSVSLSAFAAKALQDPDSAVKGLRGVASSAVAVSRASSAALQDSEPPPPPQDQTATLAASLAGANTTAYSTALIAAEQTSQPEDELNRLQGRLSEAQSAAAATVDAAASRGADPQVVQLTKQATTLSASSISLFKDKGDFKTLLPQLASSASAISMAVAQVRMAVSPSLPPLPLHLAPGASFAGALEGRAPASSPLLIPSSGPSPQDGSPRSEHPSYTTYPPPSGLWRLPPSADAPLPYGSQQNNGPSPSAARYQDGAYYPPRYGPTPLESQPPYSILPPSYAPKKSPLLAGAPSLPPGTTAAGQPIGSRQATPPPALSLNAELPSVPAMSPAEEADSSFQPPPVEWVPSLAPESYEPSARNRNANSQPKPPPPAEDEANEGQQPPLGAPEQFVKLPYGSSQPSSAQQDSTAAPQEPAKASSNNERQEKAPTRPTQQPASAHSVQPSDSEEAPPPAPSQPTPWWSAKPSDGSSEPRSTAKAPTAAQPPPPPSQGSTTQSPPPPGQATFKGGSWPAASPAASPQPHRKFSQSAPPPKLVAG